jgi:hypothetical protein
MNIVAQRTPLGWQAIDLDSFEGAPENRDEFIGGEIGRGDSEQDAIDDLMDQLGYPYSMKPLEAQR